MVVSVYDSQRYSTFPDGRRCTEWYLTDNHGVQHRAVIGEENHARDGHYVYRSVQITHSFGKSVRLRKDGVGGAFLFGVSPRVQEQSRRVSLVGELDCA